MATLWPLLWRLLLVLEISPSSQPFARSLHVPAVVVGSPAATPRAQYASNTEMALEACADHIEELHDSETAHVIKVLNTELESVQKQV